MILSMRVKTLHEYFTHHYRKSHTIVRDPSTPIFLFIPREITEGSVITSMLIPAITRVKIVCENVMFFGKWCKLVPRLILLCLRYINFVVDYTLKLFLLCKLNKKRERERGWNEK